jgi:hypothetical protein
MEIRPFTIIVRVVDPKARPDDWADLFRAGQDYRILALDCDDPDWSEPGRPETDRFRAAVDWAAAFNELQQRADVIAVSESFPHDDPLRRGEGPAPCAVILGSSTWPARTDWSNEERWPDQVDRVMRAGAVFYEKQDDFPAYWERERVAGALQSQIEATFQNVYAAGAEYLVAGAGTVVEELDAGEVERLFPPDRMAGDASPGELSTYLVPPFQLADVDFDAMIGRGRHPDPRKTGD